MVYLVALMALLHNQPNVACPANRHGCLGVLIQPEYSTQGRQGAKALRVVYPASHPQACGRGGGMGGEWSGYGGAPMWVVQLAGIAKLTNEKLYPPTYAPS